MLKYIIIVAVGALSFGMLSSFAKIAYGQGYTAAEITLTQAVAGSVILWAIVAIKSVKKDATAFEMNWKLLGVGVTMGISTYTYYLSVQYIPASLAIVLLMQMTWMSILAEWVIFGKKPGVAELLASALIIAGTLLAADVLHGLPAGFSITGICLALFSAIMYTLFVLLTSNLGTKTPLFVKSALMTTGSAITIAVINMKSLAASTQLDFGLLKWGGFLALFGTVIPPVCFTIGMPKIGAGLSSILLTLELPAAVFCAHIILGEEVSALQVCGMLLILSAIIYLNLLKVKKQSSVVVLAS
jgi:drug/metabolite transporter (DMT)-like permease